MDLAPEDLQFLTVPEILKHSISIPSLSPRTFFLITLIFIFPLSFAILTHSLFTHSFISHQFHSPLLPPPTLHHQPPHSSSSSFYLFFLYQFLYLLFLFSFSLLSTAAVVFTVASIYTSKPTSFSSTLHAIPSVFRRLFITFLWISLLLFSCNLFFVAAFIALILALAIVPPSLPLILLALFALLALFVVVYVYLTAVWHLASVISVLEPIYGLAAMKKSRELLKGSTPSGAVLVLIYLCICGGIGGVFRSIVVLGGERGIGAATRVLAGGFLVALLVLVNLVGLLVQSVFYYVCKSYHHQEIDKSALQDHLGGYLGEYVPLKSSIQMEEM